jgi:pilus assembly protein CpaB
MRRSIYSVVIGVLFAAVALFFLFNTKAKPAAAANVPVIATTAVLVASKDIPYGAKILPELSKVVQWPADSIPADAITRHVDLFEGPDAPRIALRPITANEPFLKAKVSGYGERPILSRKVSEGMRAFSVRINDVSGVAGFILPGDRVDIMLTRQLEDGGGRGDLATDVILQNVTVLGIDQMSSETVDAPVIGKSATFEVTAEQAQKLALASQVGTLSLSLRNYATLEDEQVRQIESGDLGERTAAPARPAPKKDPSVYVRVRKGSVVSSEQVAN